MKRILLLTAVLLYGMSAFTQKDSLVLVNGNVIVGEIKSMDRGVLTIETDYSDDDFKIEWDGIKSIKTDAFFYNPDRRGTYQRKFIKLRVKTK